MVGAGVPDDYAQLLPYQFGFGTDQNEPVKADLAETRAFLKGEGIVFDEFPLPGTEIHQIFLKDPMGLKIELTFDLAEEKSDA